MQGTGFHLWFGKIPHAVEQLCPSTTTTEPVCLNYWRPYAPKSALYNKRRHCSEKPACCNAVMKNSPNLLQRGVFQVALVVKPVCQCRKCETWVRSLAWEDLLEEGMATHSSILAWRIPWTGEPGSLQSIGSQRVGHDWSNSAWTHACCN